MRYIKPLNEKKPKGAPGWHDADYPDAEGRFRDLSPKDLAAWLIKTRKKDMSAISGALVQQVVFNRKEDPEYADKMEKTRKEVYKQLGREDLLDKMDESLEEPIYNSFFFLEFKSWVYKNRAKINRMSKDEKIAYLEDNYIKKYGNKHLGSEDLSGVGSDIYHAMVLDRIIKESIDGLDNAKDRLENVYKHLEIEHGQTRRGDKYVQIHYIPVSKPQSQYPEWVKVFYNSDKDLKKIGKELGMDLKESYEDILKDGYGHVHFVVKDLATAEDLADKIEAKNLADCDYYEEDGKVYLRAALSVGYSGKEVTNIKKIERIVKQKAAAGSPEIWAADESVTEAKFPGRKGDFIKWKDGYYDIKKTSGSTAYVKFPHTASSAFSQVWDDEVTLSDEKHRGKKVWLMESNAINEEDSYNDYPAAAKANAKKAIEWKEKYGRDEVDAGTAVGWQRAHQLAKGEKISADTVKRMASFNRHRKNSSIKAELKDTPWKDKGYVSWLIWGGDEGVDWAMEKSKEIDAMKESKQLKYIKPLNEGYWSGYDYDRWTKENGKPKYPKWVKVTLKEIVKGGFMDPVYDSEHMYMVLWLGSFDNQRRAELSAYDKKGIKEFGKVGYKLVRDKWNDLTSYNMFSMMGAMYALEVSKHIQDRIANGESVEPAYYMMKEYFNNFGMDTKRSRIFNAAYEKLEKWMKDNNIKTL